MLETNPQFNQIISAIKGVLLVGLLFSFVTMGDLISYIELKWSLGLGIATLILFCGYLFTKVRTHILESLLLVIVATMLGVRTGGASLMLYTSVVVIVSLSEGFKVGGIVAFLCSILSYFYMGVSFWSLLPFLLMISYLIDKRYISSISSRDGLTGMYNHSYFNEVLESFIQGKELFSLVLFDIDDFKYYNEVNGYPQGDRMLKRVAKLFEGHLAFRYSGDQFMVILDGIDKEGALDWSNEIRWKVSEVTLCAGVVTYPEDGFQLVAKAEDARDHAKFYEKDHAHRYAMILSDLEEIVGECHDEVKGMLKVLVSLVHSWDDYTYRHLLRVVHFSRLIGRELGLNAEEEEQLILGAYLHDIGKLDVDRFILNKRTPLEEDEWLDLKDHPQRGARLIQACKDLKPYEMFILYHHERYDGRGYPAHLQGEEIPFLVRILTVADSFDAMTSRRSYNEPKTFLEGIEELRRCSGAQFDPHIVEAFARVIERKEYF